MASKGLVSALLGTLLLAFSPSRGDAVCVGDCDSSGRVFPNELQLCVNIILRKTAVTACTACDRNGNGVVTPDELQAAVLSILRPTNCPHGPAHPHADSGLAYPHPHADDARGRRLLRRRRGAGRRGVRRRGLVLRRPESGNLCTSQAECPGGECRGFGGDGCALNCTDGETVRSSSTAARSAWAAPRTASPARSAQACQGGPKPGRPCSTDFRIAVPAARASRSAVRTASGALPTRECTAGQNVGADCLLTENLQTVKVHTCVGGTRDGQSCYRRKECPGGACTQRCIGGTKDGQACPFGDIQCSGREAAGSARAVTGGCLRAEEPRAALVASSGSSPCGSDLSSAFRTCT
ncbi:MAG: hypothetical protein KatS3mg076_1657 [Candidatus Binatia bacterium]|nr:MAG: hypothetical protein KatS3mg076_1657 [Candidatus Binatia bacterium]